MISTRSWRVLLGIGMVAVLGAATILACAGKHSDPDWTMKPPKLCATGSSGITIHPYDAIRYAQQNARINYAKKTKGMVIQDAVYDDGSVPRIETTQTVENIVEGTRIVAMWVGKDADGKRLVHALACPTNYMPPGVQRHRKVPDWVYTVPSPPGKLCALGVSGPTFNPYEQKDYAKKNGARALAQATLTLVSEEMRDAGVIYTIYRHASVPQSVIDECEANSELVEDWFDEEGVGPVRKPKTVYGKVCMPWTR